MAVKCWLSKQNLYNDNTNQYGNMDGGELAVPTPMEMKSYRVLLGGELVFPRDKLLERLLISSGQF